MDPFATQKRHDGTELEVTGISRSGRVRKKSSKLVDFESPGSVSDSKSKKPKIQTTPESQKKKMVVEHQTPKKIIATKKFPKQLPIKKPEIEPSSDYETQSTNSESDEENITINNNQSIKNIEVTNLKITNSANKLSNSQEHKKKVVFAKGTIKINKNKVEENKTKPKSRYTAYMLWSKEMRQKLLKENPGMDFTTVSKKLGELWSAVPTNEKYNWNNRAKRLTEKNQTISPTLPKTLVIKTNEPKKTIEISTLMNSSVSNQAGKDANKSPTKDLQIFRTIELEPIDVAAYLKLLGESLTCIGERLKEHNGQITVSGSLSVLLDSLLCALGSLTCLTQQVPEIRSQNSAALSKTLENIAYIMPGL